MKDRNHSLAAESSAPTPAEPSTTAESGTDPNGTDQVSEVQVVEQKSTGFDPRRPGSFCVEFPSPEALTPLERQMAELRQHGPPCRGWPIRITCVTVDDFRWILRSAKAAESEAKKETSTTTQPRSSEGGVFDLLMREAVFGLLRTVREDPHLLGVLREHLGVSAPREDDPEALRVPNFAKHFDLQPATVRKYIKQGLPHWGASHSTLIPLAEGREWLKNERSRNGDDDEVEQLAEERGRKDWGRK